MTNEVDDILRTIESAIPANEAEVETKILLYVFRLLGFTDIDRADKPTITMYYGHEVKLKEPDFILYDGPERTLANALITVEAKAIGKPIDSGKPQAKSYAVWAGTPFYVVCNGETLLAVQFIPGAQEFRTLTISVREISDHWQDLYEFLSRAEVILAKERLAYLSYYLPNVETLPPSQFLKEYLNRLSARFSVLAETRQALIPPTRDQQIIPRIPVSTRLREGTIQIDLDEKGVATYLLDDQKRLFIEGTPGCGKSTLCKRVINHLAEAGLEPGARIIPIYIPLGRFVPDRVPDALIYSCTEMGVRSFPNLYQESLKRARVILILDGLDEVDLSDSSRAKLKRLTHDTSCNIMLTSRPAAIEPALFDQKFTFAVIRDLTDQELLKVFKEYLGDQKEIAHFWDKTTPALKSALHSPLFALMAIRVAQSHPDWISLSTYRLFEKYVSALHGFFNADTVRGTGEIISLDKVLSALSKVAISLQKRGEFAAVSLHALAHEMRDAGYEAGFTALINIGLVSVAGGRPILAHQGFQEFAIARHLLKCIQEYNISGFIEAQASEFTYQLVHSEIRAEDETRLIQWLSANEKQVRRRVLGILRYGTSPVAIDRVRSLLGGERSLRAWSAAVRVLTLHQDEQFLEDIFTAKRPLSKRKQRILAWALRTSEFTRYLSWALRLAESRKQHAATACAFELALKLGSNDVADSLIDLYHKENPNQRRNLCRLLNEYCETSLTQAIATILLPQEKSPICLIYILNCLRDHLPGMPSSQLVNACEVLGRAKRLRSKDRRRLRAISISLKESAPVSEIRQRLLSLCDDLGAYQEDIES